MTDAEKYVERWLGAGLLTGEQAEAIRAYERVDEKPSRARWQVTLALTFGALLFSAGILLFVAAHWDELGPGAQFALVLGMLGLLHGAGLYCAERFPKLSTTLHVLGTAACGAAIALTGQIFQMNEHWPAAILLWALCAAAGWYLLRDGFHEAFTCLLVPAWVFCEWADRANNYRGNMVYGARILAVLGAVYLAAFLRARSSLRAVMMTAGVLVLVPSLVMLPEGWTTWRSEPLITAGIIAAAFVLILLFAAAGFLREKNSVIASAVVFAVAMILPYCVRNNARYVGDHEMSVVAYLLLALLAAFFAWWGVRQVSRALVNLGIAGFAAVVLWFYFSSLMDRLGRSLGLISLGVLFLAGGWVLERFRRRLMHQIGEVHP